MGTKVKEHSLARLFRFQAPHQSGVQLRYWLTLATPLAGPGEPGEFKLTVTHVGKPPEERKVLIHPATEGPDAYRYYLPFPTQGTSRSTPVEDHVFPTSLRKVELVPLKGGVELAEHRQVLEHKLPLNEPAARQLELEAPRLVVALNTAFGPGWPEGLSLAGGRVADRDLARVLTRVYGRLTLDLDMTWSSLDGHEDLWDEESGAEQWARAVTEALLCQPYLGPEVAYGLSSARPLYEAFELGRPDPAYPIVAACQHLATMGALALGFTVDQINPGAAGTLTAGAGSGSSPLFTGATTGPHADAVAGRWFGGADAHARVDPTTTLNVPLDEGRVGPGSVYTWDDGSQAAGSGAHIAFVLRTGPNHLQFFDTGGVTAQADAEHRTSGLGVMKGIPARRTCYDDPVIGPSSRSAHQKKVPTSNGATLSGLGILPRAREDAAHDAHLRACAAHVRGARPLGLARLVVARRAAGDGDPTVFVSPLVLMHEDDPRLSYPIARYLHSLRDMEGREHLQAWWVIYTPRGALAEATLGARRGDSLATIAAAAGVSAPGPDSLFAALVMTGDADGQVRVAQRYWQKKDSGAVTDTWGPAGPSDHQAAPQRSFKRALRDSGVPEDTVDAVLQADRSWVGCRMPLDASGIPAYLRGRAPAGSPRVLRFEARVGSAPLGTRVVIGPGDPIHFEWTLEGGGEDPRLELFGGSTDLALDVGALTHHDGGRLAGAFTLQAPAANPPDAQRRYHLRYTAGDAAATAEVTVAGILALELEVDKAQDPQDEFFLWNRAGTQKLSRLSGRSGSYRDLSLRQLDREFWGQVTCWIGGVVRPAPLRLSWRVLLEPGWRAFLEVEPGSEEDVGDAGTGEKRLADPSPAAKLMFFRADLRLREGPTEGDATVVQGRFVLRENRPAPELTGFEVRHVQTGEQIPSNGQLDAWGDLSVRWTLDGDFVQNRLWLQVDRVRSDGTRETVEEPRVIRSEGDAQRAGEHHPGADPANPKKFDGDHLVIVAELRNLQTSSAEPRGQLSNVGEKGRREVHVHITRTLPSIDRLVSLEEALDQANGSLLHNTASLGPEEVALTDPLEAFCPPSKTAAESDPALKAIWSWKHGPALNEVRDVFCRVHSHHFHAMQVCERVAWGDDIVVTKHPKLGEGPKDVSLPLQDVFLLKKLRLREGFVPGQATHREPARRGHYWKLRMDLDESFMLVFGYEIPPGSDQARPFASPARFHEKLFPLCPADAPAGQPSRARVVQVDPDEPIHVGVCLTFACCKERADFEPGKVNYAARLLPMVHILSSQDLARARVSVIVERPSTSSHGHHADPEMHARINPLLFTDSNDGRMGEVYPGFIDWATAHAADYVSMAKLYAVAPFWHNFFDYYRLPDEDGSNAMSFRAVEHVPVGNDQPMVDGLVKEFFQRRVHYERFAVRKEPGQGDFDSVHLAPQMKLPDEIRSHGLNASRFTAHPAVAGGPSPPEWGTGWIGMAPFCIHDCLHTHWRWGSMFAGEVETWQQWGWFDFDPFADPGKPIVPPNQTVDVDIPPSGHSFKQVITIHGPEAGRWQVANHNGSAYAVNVAPSVDEDMPKLLDNEATSTIPPPFLWLMSEPGIHKPRSLWLLSTAESWALRYWKLRWGGREVNTFDVEVCERLKFTASELTTFMKHRVASHVWGPHNQGGSP